jgi:hypothetical protein
MKKNLFYAIILLFTSVLLAACSKDDDDNKSNDNNPLVGTKWYSSNYATAIYGGLNGGTWNLVYEFKSNNTYHGYFYSLTTKEIGTDYGISKYKYLKDHITLIKDDGTDGTTFWFRSDTWLCSEKEGVAGDMISLWKNKPQY